MRDLTGKQFYHYRLIRLLGEGAFGDVYLGEHIDQRAPVAVKVLKIQLTKDTLKEFLNEARTFRLKHPHIVQLLDFGIEDDIPFLVMDYAPNGTLRQRHPRGSRLSLETIVTYVKQVSDALQYAHDMKTIHRDVKPQNILLGKNNELLLSDFGIAVIAHRESSIITQNTAGTLPYMAPEQLQRKPQPASDQYALGVIVYEWLCGTLPFQGSEAEIIHQHLYISPPSLKEKIPAIHPSVEMVVQKALAKEPGNRFSHIKDFADAFETASKQTGQLQHMPPPSVPPSNTRSSTPAQKPLSPLHRLSVPDGKSEMNNKPGISKPVTPPVAALNPTPELQHQSAIPPSNVPAQPSAGTVEPANAAETADGAAANAGRPVIIKLNPVRQKARAKLSPSEQAAANQPPVPPGNANVAGRSTRPRNSGKMPAAAMVGADGASMVAGPPPPQRIGGGGNFPPRPGMGGGGSPRRRSKRHRRYLLLLALLLLLTVLVTMSAIMAFNPKMVASMLPGASSTIVTITPDSKLISNSYVIQGVPGTPDPAQRQIAVRQITATTKSDPKTVNTTGHTQTLGTTARGQLTFTNGSFSPFTVAAGTVINSNNGVAITIDAPAFIPAATPPSGPNGQSTVSAHATIPGANGNISALVINQSCCAANFISVKNPLPFTGGQDAQDYHFVQQSDVDGVANPLKSTISAQAQASLQRQLRTGEQFVAQNGNNPCPSKVTTDNPVGPQGTNFNTVTVTVTATCNALAYDHAGLQTMVANLLGSKANTDIGSSYKLAGQVVMHTKVQNIDQGNVSLLVDARGVWVAQISDVQKADLAKAIAGKSIEDVQHIFAGHKEIDHANIQTNGNTLPKAPNQIAIVIQNVPGAQDTATPPPRGPGSSTPVNGPGGIQTPLPGKG